MSESLKDRVTRRLADLGRNPFEAARKGGLERGFINDIVQGKKSSVRGDNLARLAAGLDWEAADLIDPKPAREPRTLPTGVLDLPIRFEVAAGAWQATDDIRDEPIGVFKDAHRLPGYEQFPQWIERVVGDSYNRKIPEGSLVHVVDAVAMGYAPRHGDTVVVVRRRAQGAFIERSLKEVVLTPHMVELWPRSHNERWVEPLNYFEGVREDEDLDVEIAGKVIRSYQTF